MYTNISLISAFKSVDDLLESSTINSDDVIYTTDLDV